jgi:hypothetical protein
MTQKTVQSVSGRAWSFVQAVIAEMDKSRLKNQATFHNKFELLTYSL